MKFTKEEAFEILKGILTNNGKKTLRMSEKSINKQLESLIPLIANEEMELNDFVGKVKDTFSVMNSNAEKDNSDFVKQWEKDHQKQDPEPPKQVDAKDDSVMEKMLRRLEELENREAERDKEAKVLQKKKDLLKVMREKGIKDEQWAKDFVAEISLTEDFDIESKSESYLKLYNKSQAASASGNATPKNASGSGNREENPFKAASELMKQEKEQFKNLK